MFSFFERAAVINLPTRLDRRLETEAELRAVGGMRSTIVPAIRPANSGKFGSVGERGCYLSHLKVLTDNRGAASILIMEDDVRFAQDCNVRALIVGQLPGDWDIFYAGYQQAPNLHRVSGLVEVDREVEFTGAHCYAVSGRAISKLITALETFLTRERGDPRGGPMPFDGALNVARRQLSLKTFVAVPPLAYQRSSRSDIAQLKWFDRLEYLRNPISSLRKLKNRLRSEP